MTQVEIAIGAIVAALAGIAVGAIRSATDASRLRTRCLRAAKAKSNQFYDGAETLLEDPATPALLKNMIFDLGLAVTDDKAGRKAVELIHCYLSETRSKGYMKQPGKEFAEKLDTLRKHRGDLYDLFHDTLGAGFAAIILMNCVEDEQHRFVEVYELNGANRSFMLRLAEILDQAFSDWGRRWPPSSGAKPAWS